MIKLLIVDDSALMRRMLGSVFESDQEYEVALARNGIEALAELKKFEPDVITLDVHMPGMDGLTCLDRIMLERPCPVIMVSSLTEAGAEETLEAMRLGAIDFIAKPKGAISLSMEEFGPALRDKVRIAVQARLPSAARLRDRVRLQTNLRGKSAMVPRAPGRLLDTVVIVGCSTGGPPALDALLSALPEDFPWPLLVAQHMPGTFTGSLSRRLDQLCALNVVEVTKQMSLEPGNVYIAKGDADMTVVSRLGNTFVTPVPSASEYRWHPSVDRLVESALRHLGPQRLVGVLMTGMGNDGARTMALMKEGGGRTIAEAEETATVWGMPGELVKCDGADIVAPVHAIASHLIGWTR